MPDSIATMPVTPRFHGGNIPSIFSVDARLPPRERLALCFEICLCVGAGDIVYDIEPGAALSEVQLRCSGVPNDPNGAVYDVLQHGLESPSLHADSLGSD